MKMKLILLLTMLILNAAYGKEYPQFPVIGDVPPMVHILSLGAFSLTLVVLVRSLVIYYNCPVPCVVLIYTTGITLGFLLEYTEIIADYEETIYYIDPKMLLNIVLPSIIFKSSFCLDAYAFVRAWLQIFTVSILGVLITSFLVGLIEMAVLSWTFLMGLIFAIIVTPIHPFEVVKLLKEVDKSKHVTILLEGESVLGVGFCILFFHIFMSAYQKQIELWYQYVGVFIRICGGGIILGLVVGKICTLIVSKLYTDPLCMMTLTVASCYLTYGASVDWFAVSGITGCVVVGIILGMERKSLSPEVETFLTTNWALIAEYIDSFLFLTFGCLTVPIFMRNATIIDYGLVLMTYTLVMAARLISYILLAPILSRVGYGFNLRDMIIMVWGGIKGSLTYCMMLIIYAHPAFKDFSPQIALHTVGLVILTLLFNATTTRFLLNLTGMFDFSVMRKVNMNNCVRFIRSRRERTISMLKMDRFLADANWPIIHDATAFNHPYKISNESFEGNEEEYFLGNRFAKCPECEKEIPAEPTQKEMNEMIREARMRILKAKKVSYARQYENGLITKDGFRILNQCVEAAMDSEEVMTDIEGLQKLFKRQKLANYLRRKIFLLFSLKKRKEIKVPLRKWRRLCYRVVTHKGFDYFIYVVILSSIAPILVEFIIPPPKSSFPDYVIKSLNAVFFCIYLTEFLLKVCASSFTSLKDGFQTYFRSYWNIFDFIVLIGASADFALDLMDLLNPKFSKRDFVVAKITLIIRLSRVLRLLELLNLLGSLHLKLIKFIDSKIGTKTGYAYDIGKGFVTGEEEVIDMLLQMVDNPEIRDNIRRRMETNRLIITRELGLLQREKPTIAVTVKTKQAIMSVINSMSDAVYELKTSGWIDDVEYRKLMDSVTIRLKYVRTITVIEPCTPKMIFEEVPWMGNNADLIDFLYSRVRTKIFDPGDKVCEEGEISEGVFILVTGLLKLTYIPSHTALNNTARNGVLPILDYIGSSKFNEGYENYIVSGNSVGELCTLTKRKYDCTITADIPSQAFLLTHGVMQEAMNKYNDGTRGLATKIWKYVSVRLATAILMEVPAYQSIRQEKIKYTLERSFVPDLNEFRVFAVNDMMEDIVLLEGVAVDYNTKDAYIAPCYIPRTVQKLTFLNRSSTQTPDTNTDTKFLIIPMMDADDYEIMETGIEMSEMKSVASRRCLQHGIQQSKKRKRRKKTMFNISHKRSEQSDLSFYFNKSGANTRTSIQTEATSIFTELEYSGTITMEHQNQRT